jgi:hypothetical protein
LMLRVAMYADRASFKTSMALIAWALDVILEWVTSGEWQ